MNAETYLGWLKDWFHARSPETVLSLDDNYFEAGVLSSFEVIELIEDAETAFNIRFQDQDFQDRRFVTIQGLAEILSEKQP